jgi:hypothetical protein
MPLNHAKHNLEVCKFLRDNTSYFDWIVTTAYYSSIHYVSYCLFPGKYEDSSGNIKQFSSFKSFCRSQSIFENKHRLIEELVEENLPEIHSAFKTLKDNCWTARYDDYNIHRDIVSKCLQCIDTVAEFCVENKQ